MRTRAAHRVRPAVLAALAPLALVLALACSDAPPTAPGGLADASLPVVRADAVPAMPPGGRALAALPDGAAAQVLVLLRPDLGTLGGDTSAATALSAEQVVGWSQTADGAVRAFSVFSVMEPLPTPAGVFSKATAVASGPSPGPVVGYTFTRAADGSETAEQAFLNTWRLPGVVPLPSALGHEAAALAVNDARQIAGWAATGARGDNGERVTHPVLWQPGGEMIDLAAGEPSGGFGRAAAINDAGQIVGAFRNEAFRWTAAEGRVGLGTLGPGASAATAVNNAGQVAGWSQAPPDGSVHAFVWDATHGMVDINGPGVARSEATAITEAGAVVGTAIGPAPDSRPHGFYWSPSTGMVDLEAAVGGHFTPAAALGNGEFAVLAGAADSQHGGRHAFEVAVRVFVPGAPQVSGLRAVALPPGVVPGLSGVWLRVHITDRGDSGPWTWTIDWGDGVETTTAAPVPYTGQFVFLRSAPYTTPGPHFVRVMATDAGGRASAPLVTVAR